MEIPKARDAFNEQLAESQKQFDLGITARRVSEQAHYPGKVSAIIGTRKCGKTALLKQLRQERIRQGIPPERLPFISFNDIRLSKISSFDLRTVIFEYHQKHLSQAHSDGPPVTWFLDEIQAASGWDKFLTRLVAFQRADAFVAGDATALEPSRLATGMSSRLSQIHLHPFSFEEALRHQGLNVPQGPNSIALMSGQERSNLQRRLLDWLSAGGFPEAQGKESSERRELLGGYLDLTILREAVEQSGARHVAAIRMLAQDVFANAGRRYSLMKFCTALESRGISLSIQTARQYLKHLEKSLLIRTVEAHLEAGQKSSTHARKVYPADTGYISAFKPFGIINIGQALETAVFLELARRGCRITYAPRSMGLEIDFISLGRDGGTELIQVCADLSDLKIAERKLQSLAEAKNMLQPARRLVLVLTRGMQPAEIPPGIELLSVSEWLLDRDD